MKYKIYFKYKDGSQDEIILEGENVEAIREKVCEEIVKKRNAIPLFSEKI